MKKVIDQFNKLCSPAMLYFVISAISFLAMLFQNCDDSTKYKVGTMEVESPCHNAVFFIVKALYILAWTYVLNILCNKGYKTVSWALVLLPIISMFLLIGLVFIVLLKDGKKVKEGMEVDENYADNFQPNPAVEGKLPPLNIQGAPTIDGPEGFIEGAEDECGEGQEKDADGNCVDIENFTNYREGMEDDEEDEEGMEDDEGKEEDEDEGFVGEGNWPSVGQLL